MLDLDGSGGGGQLFRSALALSTLTETPIEMHEIRGDRPEPGLRPQHLAVLETLTAITDASVEGCELGAETVSFEPGTPTGGRYEATIETAGSVTLLFDAILPLASTLDRPLQVAATGGTSVAWSPSMPWYRRVKLPVLRRAGLPAAVDCHRSGFYPAGGGRATLSLAPADLPTIDRHDRGARKRTRVHSTATADLAESDVAERQADQACDRLQERGIDVTERLTQSVEADSTGSVVLVGFAYEHGVIGAESLGEPGKPAEAVADDAVAAAIADHASGAAVDSHLADQLIPWLAIAGGSVTIPRVTEHVRTHCDLVEQFGYDVRIEAQADGPPTLIGRAGERA